MWAVSDCPLPQEGTDGQHRSPLGPTAERNIGGELLERKGEEGEEGEREGGKEGEGGREGMMEREGEGERERGRGREGGRESTREGEALSSLDNLLQHLSVPTGWGQQPRHCHSGCWTCSSDRDPFHCEFILRQRERERERQSVCVSLLEGVCD